MELAMRSLSIFELIGTRGRRVRPIATSKRNIGIEVKELNASPS